MGGLPDLTIRQFLMRRSSQYARRTMAFLIGSGALLTIGASIFVVRFACAVVALVVAVAAFSSLFHIPCPKCHQSLGIMGFKVANSGLGRRKTATAHCPHCNVSVDEPMP
jgi:hypothetical protein